MAEKTNGIEKTNVIDLPSREEVAAALQPPEDDFLDGLSLEEQRIAAKILPGLEKTAAIVAEAKKARELKSLTDQLTAENTKLIEGELQKLRDANKPPSQDQLNQLLSQEYITFPLKIKERGGQTEREKEFTIRELPQAVELKFLKIIQKTLVPRLKEFSSIDWNAGMSNVEKLQRVIDTVPEGMDMLADLAAIALDPYEADGINKTWVQANLSSNRIMAVIQSQVVAGRFRDFFLAVQQSIPS